MIYVNNNKPNLLIISKCICKKLDINSEVYYDQLCFHENFDLISFQDNKYSDAFFNNIINKYTFIYAFHYTSEILKYLINNKDKYSYKLFIHELENLDINKYNLNKVDKISSWSPSKLINIHPKMSSQIKEKLFWIHQGIRLTKQNQDKIKNISNNSNERYIVSIGDTNRDHEMVIKAVQNLDIKLYIISKNVYNNKNVVNICTTKSKIIDNERVFDTCKIIKNALFCIIPLHYKHQSHGITSAIEVCFLRKCLIITQNSGLDEYIEDNYTGFKIPHKDVNTCKNKIQYLLNDSNRQEMEENIKNKIGNNNNYMTNEGFIEIVLDNLKNI
jgi:glycosyltransferase involved in cell wall biosynthesis